MKCGISMRPFPRTGVCAIKDGYLDGLMEAQCFHRDNLAFEHNICVFTNFTGVCSRLRVATWGERHTSAAQSLGGTCISVNRELSNASNGRAPSLCKASDCFAGIE